MISSIRPKQSISWTFLNDAVAISAKELPKNHTDKERFAATSSCFATGILTFSRANDGVLVPVHYQPPRSRSRRVSDLKVPINMASGSDCAVTIPTWRRVGCSRSARLITTNYEQCLHLSE